MPSAWLGDVASAGCAVSFAERKVSIAPVERRIDRSIILCFLPKLRAPPHLAFPLRIANSHRWFIFVPHPADGLREGSFVCRGAGVTRETLAPLIASCFVFIFCVLFGQTPRRCSLVACGRSRIRSVCTSRAFWPNRCCLCLLAEPEFIPFRALCEFRTRSLEIMTLQR